VLARKPGNVHPEASFEDLTAADFLTAGEAVAPVLARTAGQGIGRSVYEAVAATKECIATNANLGICLLIAPIAAAAIRGGELRDGLRGVLKELTIDDARWAYRAIRLAVPGGLGTSTEQDVAAEPTVTLLDAMRMAAGRDLVARQYATAYDDVFDIAIPAMFSQAAGEPEVQIVAAHLHLMARLPDTLILRKCGPGVAEESASRAANVLEAGWPNETGRALERELDAWLRADGHRRNPGATADAIAASLLAGFLVKAIDVDEFRDWRNRSRLFVG
jgi:triphosphoribosyl-dephospho-CoA synthase